MKKVYVAGPYRAESISKVEENIARARYWTKRLIEKEYLPVTPHMLFALMDGVASDEYFLKAGLDLLEGCDYIYVMPHDGMSVGTQGEINYAKLSGIPTLKWEDIV